MNMNKVLTQNTLHGLLQRQTAEVRGTQASWCHSIYSYFGCMYKRLENGCKEQPNTWCWHDLSAHE